MIKTLLITNKGCEEAAKKELSERFAIKKSKISDYAVEFEVPNHEKIMEVCYFSQSAAKILILLDNFEFNSVDDIKERIESLDMKEYFDEDTPFSCRAAVFESDISKQELEAELGDSILKKIKRKVNLEDPGVQFYALIAGKRCFFGIDFAGIDLSMREYKVFTGRDDLKGNIAFSLLMIAGCKKGETIADPFMKNGLIPIEAGLFFLDFPVNYYQKEKFLFRKFPKLKNFDFEGFFGQMDKKIREESTKIYGIDPLLRNVKAAQKNAKVAGILKRINLTKQDVEWLDTRFKEGEVDRIVSLMPKITRFSDRAKVEKEYNEFFHQADYILSKKGSVLAVSMSEDMIVKCAKANNFKIIEKKIICQGSLELDVFILGR